GGAAKLAERYGAKILIGELDAPYVIGDSRLPPPRGLAGVGFRLFGGLVRFEHFKPNGVLKDGDSVGRLRVVHTPGHTPGSICLFDTETHTIFSGDALLSSGGEPSPPSKSFSLNYVEAIHSTKRMVELNVENLCPGHGEPIVGGVSVKLRASYEKWKMSL
ncbi:MAG: MBL fold metallo-hydrolase, partial [Thermoprotei archaeon]